MTAELKNGNKIGIDNVIIGSRPQEAQISTSNYLATTVYEVSSMDFQFFTKIHEVQND